MDHFLALLLALLLLDTAAGVVVQWRLRRLLEAHPSDPEVALPPKLRLDTSPRDSLNFLAAVSFRRYARHSDLRVRRSGDLLLISYLVQIVVLMLCAAVLIGNQRA